MAIAARLSMPVRFAFLRPHGEPHTAGPCREVSFARDDLLADGEAIGTYIEHRWQVRGAEDRYSSIEFNTRVDVCFQRQDNERSKTFGPYNAFRLMDGIAYASGHVFAFYDLEQRDWYSSALGNHWPRMIVMATSA